jgi:hypothetical protein
LNDFINIIERKGYDWELLQEEKKKRLKNMSTRQEFKESAILKY